MVLIIPESILAIYIWVLGTCREVLDLYVAHSNPAILRTLAHPSKSVCLHVLRLMRLSRCFFVVVVAFHGRYGNVAFYPLVTAWLALAVLFWLVQCCGGFALRRRYSREPSFEDPVVTATLSANPSGFERCWNSSLCLCLRSTCPKFGP